MTSLPLARVLKVCYISARFCFALIGGNWQLTQRGATGELEVEFKFQTRSSSSCSFSRPAARAPQRVCSQTNILLNSPTRQNRASEGRALQAGWCTFKSKSPVPSRDHLLRDWFDSFKQPPLNLDSLLTLVNVRLNCILGGGILLNVLFFSSTVDRHPSDSLHSPFCGRILTRVSDATQFICRDGHLYVHCTANF